MKPSRVAPMAGLLGLVFIVAASLPASLIAETAGFAKENLFGIWSKNRFADAVIVSGPHKTVYLSGMGAEEETDGHILHPGNFAEQCRYAHEKIKKLLAMHGASETILKARFRASK